MSKPIIAVDIDDVLARHYEALAKFAQEQWGLPYTAADYHGDIASLWGVTPEVREERMWAFQRAGLHEEMEAVTGAFPVLDSMKHKLDFHAVSQQVRENTDIKTAWVRRNYPDIFKGTHYIHPFEGDTRTKADICLEIGASYLIDDNLKHCKQTVGVGITALLFGGFEGRGLVLPENVIEVADWPAVKEYFDGLG